jgi:prepilin-type N-terminal cleavage/methylation domain-containing protein
MKLRIANCELRICRRRADAENPKADTPNSKFEIRHSQFSRAFTLIEVMIAMTIFSLVVAAIYSSWDLIWRASRVSQAAAAQVQRQRVAIHTIEDALTCIQSFQASMRYYSFIVNEEPPELDFTSRLPDNFPRNGKFGDLNVRQLMFTLEADPDSEKDLVLRQKPILLDLDADEQKNPLVLARFVQTFKVECWDTNQAEWVTEWDDTNSIPPLIRVKLVLGGNNNQNGNPAPTLSVTRVIAVPSQSMPAVVQTGGGVPRGGGPGLTLPPPVAPGGGNNNPNNPGRINRRGR